MTNCLNKRDIDAPLARFPSNARHNKIHVRYTTPPLRCTLARVSQLAFASDALFKPLHQAAHCTARSPTRSPRPNYRTYLMTYFPVYLIFVVSLFAISSANGNYGYGQYTSTVCDRGLYDRAQNTLRAEITQPRGVLQPGQPPYHPSYGQGMTNGYQGDNGNQQLDHQCRSVRTSFKDLLIFTPLCEAPQIGSYNAALQNSVNLLEQSRQFMKSYCERNQGYQFSACFKGSDLAQCESQFSYSRTRSPVNTQVNSGYNSQPGYVSNQPQSISLELCHAFNIFRNCVFNVTSRHCYSEDQIHQFAYLYDHGRNLAYSCTPSTIGPIYSPNPNLNPINPIGIDYSRRTDLGYQNPLPNSNYPGSYAGSYSGSYPASNPGQLSPFSARQMPTYQQAGNLPASTNRFGGVLDPALSAPAIDVCIAKVQPYESACSELLVQRQREARYGRSSNDVQRRICCAIFYYRDCVSRMVLERCKESTRTVVDLIMGDRNRELSTNCRDYTREQCNGMPSLQASLVAVVLAFFLAVLFR